MVSRTDYYAESLGSVTTTSTTWEDKGATLTQTLSNGIDYFIFGSEMLDGSSTASTQESRIYNDTDASAVVTHVYECKDPADIYSVFGFGKVTGSGASKTFKWQAQASGGSTTNITDSRLYLLQKESADEYAESNAESTTTSTSYQDKTTLTFTPGSSGDYLIIAYAEIANTNGSAANRTMVTLLDNDGSTARNEMDPWFKDITDWLPWAGMIRKTSLSGSQTFKIQYKAVADTAKIRNARILAIRLDTVDNNYYAEDRTRQTSTATAETDRLTLTQTPQAVDHVVFGTAIFDNHSTTLNDDLRFYQGATSWGMHTMEGGLSGTSLDRCYFVVSRQTLTAVSTTWKFTVASEAGTVTNGIDQQAISILQTAATPGGGGTPTQPRRALLGVGY